MRRRACLAVAALAVGTGCTSTVAGTPSAAQSARPTSTVVLPSGPTSASGTPPVQLPGPASTSPSGTAPSVPTSTSGGTTTSASMCTLLPASTVNKIFGETMTTQAPSKTSCTWVNPGHQILIVSVWQNLDLYHNLDGNRRRFTYQGHPAQLGMNEFGISLGSKGTDPGVIEALGLEARPSFEKAGQKLAEQLLHYYS